MRKVGLILAGLVALLALIVGVFIGWTLLFRPRVRQVTDRKYVPSPQRLERGRYIVATLGTCLRCHSPGGMSKPLAGTEGSGRLIPSPQDNPFKHVIVAPNITPDNDTGIGRWTDDEIGRAIREGVDRNGRSFTLAMPCLQYRNMSDEDLASVVVYLRSITPLRNSLPQTQLAFPVQFLVRLVPLPVNSPVSADLSTPERRGQYLATLATCNECHSSHDFAHHPNDGLEFVGGDVVRFGPAAATATNLTPDETGIGSMTAGSFRELMRTGQLRGQTLHPIMPCDQYVDVTDDDLNDIYLYLRSLRPVKHIVDAAAVVTKCRICKNQHGGGSLN